MIDRASLRSRAGHYIKRPDTVAGSERGGSAFFIYVLHRVICHRATMLALRTAQKVSAS